jgi:hypothetical protein
MYQVKQVLFDRKGHYAGTKCHATTNDLHDALHAAQLITDQGELGFIRRISDGAIRLPGGPWLPSQHPLALAD